MLSVDIKRIETALAAGRLEIAFGWLMESPRRDHLQGQQMATRLGAAFLERARKHLGDHRYDEAKNDFEKARSLCGQTVEVAALGGEIRTRWVESNRAEESRRRATQLAKIQAELGQYTLGTEFLQSDPKNSEIANDLDRNRKVAEDAARRVESETQEGDFESALKILQSLPKAMLQHRSLSKPIGRLADQFGQQATQLIQSGRLDRAGQIVRQLDSILPQRTELNDQRDTINCCYRARNLFQSGCFAEADQELARAENTMTDLDWIGQVRESLTTMSKAKADIMAGPLSMLQASGHELTLPGTPPAFDKQANRSRPPCAGEPVGTMATRSAIEENAVSASLLLRIDGVGAILLLPGDRVSIGSASRTKLLDVAIATEGPGSPIHVRRSGEDYFVESEGSIRVNDVLSTQRLLVSGDSIAYGRRGRLKFLKPVAVSGTALLEVTGARLAKREIRHIALFADSLVLGTGISHFALPGDQSRLVLYREGDQYCVKDVASGQRLTLDLDRTVLVNDTRFTLHKNTTN